MQAREEWRGDDEHANKGMKIKEAMMEFLLMITMCTRHTARPPAHAPDGSSASHVARHECMHDVTARGCGEKSTCIWEAILGSQRRFMLAR